MAKVIKVVKRRPGDEKLVSAIISAYDTRLVVEYGPGVISVAPVGRLFAFDNEQDAKRFATEVSYPEVWEAHAGSAYPITTRIPRVDLGLDGIRQWWKRLLNGMCKPPTGTVSCDYIILQRRIS